MYVKYSKVRSNVTNPSRSNPSDAGLDVYWCPSHDEIMKNGGKDITINPGDSVLLQTGLKFEIPHGYMIQVCNRGSMGAIKSLVYGAHIVDSGYEDEIFINLHNIGKIPRKIHVDDKIAQLVMTPVVHFSPVEVDEGDLYINEVTMSKRGNGKLGSTGS